MAKLLRRIADAVEVEAEGASGDIAGASSGCVANALSELGLDFVKHRKPAFQ